MDYRGIDNDILIPYIENSFLGLGGKNRIIFLPSSFALFNAFSAYSKRSGGCNFPEGTKVVTPMLTVMDLFIVDDECSISSF